MSRNEHPEEKLFIYSVFGVAFGCWGFWSAFVKMRERRYITETPASKIKLMPMGLVEIQGAVRAPNPLVAPLSGLPCACYKILVEVKGDKDSWNKVGEDFSEVLFELEDETGKALIDPKGAELQFDDKSFFHQGAGSSLPSPCRQFMDRKNIQQKELFVFDRVFRLTEWAIPVGKAVFMMGLANPPPDDDGDPDARYSGLVSKPTDDRPYVISEYSQRDLVSKLDASINLGLFGAPLLVAACVGYILYYLFGGGG